MRSLRAFVWGLLTASTLVLAGCSSDAASEHTDDGALEGNSPAFRFNVNSGKERAGEVDLTNAYAAAWLSKVAYDNNDDESLKRVLVGRGVPVVEVVAFHAGWTGKPLQSASITGTDGYYLRTRDAGFIVFRGSEDGVLADAIADLRVFQWNAGPALNRAGKGEIHAGFYHGLRAVWEPLRTLVKDRHKSGLPLYVMGHSLGGALATVALHHLLFDKCLHGLLSHIDIASTCAREYIPVNALYTFGSPRSGDQEFVTELAKRTRETRTQVFRFVNEGDEVSMLPHYAPAAVVEPYRHFGIDGDERTFAILLERNGKITHRPQSRCETNPSLVQCDTSSTSLALNAVSGVLPWKVEHSLSIYEEKLRALFTNTPNKLDKVRRDLGER